MDDGWAGVLVSLSLSLFILMKLMDECRRGLSVWGGGGGLGGGGGGLGGGGVVMGGGGEREGGV